MFLNHIKTALRQITRNGRFFAINILGLSLGMALVILISVFVRHEMAFDQWMEDGSLTYRVYRIGNHGETAWTPSRLAEKMGNDYPEVASSTGWGPMGDILVTYANNDWYLDNTAQVDSTFFDVLPMEFLAGDRKTALDNPNSVVLSEELATRIFSEYNPIGEVITIDGGSEYIVTGVLRKESKRSHITSDLFIRFTHYGNVWRYNNRATYVKLRPNSDPLALAQKVKADVNQLITQEYIANGNSAESVRLYDWALQPLQDIYLHSEGWTAQGEKGSIRMVFIFGLIALIVLLVAIVNFVNLSTAQASQRSKEIGVRKVTGAGRGLLTRQFLVESVIASLVAGIGAMALAELCLPYFNQIVDRQLHIIGADFPFVLFGTFVLAICTGLLAGVYPAFIMAGFKPAKALKSNFLQIGHKSAFRKALVISQFAICLTLMIVMAFIYRQVNYMVNEDLGFQPDQVLTIPINAQGTADRVHDLKSKFKEIPGVQEITLASAFPGEFLPDWNMIIEGQVEAPAPYVLFTDEDFIKALNIEVLEGRFIDDDIEEDHHSNFVVNRAFVDKYGITEAIGTRIKWDSDEQFGQIIGVLNDFHFRGLSEKIQPLVINADNWRSTVGIKISGDRIEQAIPQIEALWSEIEPAFPMRYSFLDDDFDALYSSQERFGRSILYATVLTLFIALLGLFGLTAFSVRRRTKEIGIRKVLGASVGGIVGLLAREHLKLLCASAVIALPISYFFANQWLADFAYRTTMVWWIFAGAILLILLLGFFTVSIQTAKAALVNPVNSLEEN